jgi:DNA transposition AAA+ family ATPase
MNIADQLKRAIRDSGFSQKEIADGAGVPQPTLSRFLLDPGDSRHRDIRLEGTAAKLAKFLGLELRPIGTRRRSGKTK